MSRHRCHYTSIPPVKLVDRRLPSFEDMKQYDNGYRGQEWETDHKAPSRGRYKERDGVRVYEGGFIEVTSYVYRNPEARQTLARKYGLQILPPKECAGIKFFSPDGVPVSRSAVKNDSLLLDKQTMRAYAFDIAWDTSRFAPAAPPRDERGLFFATPGAVPVSHSTILADVPDLKRVREVMRENKEFFKACAVTARLMGTAAAPAGSYESAEAWLQARLRGDAHDLLTPSPDETVLLGRCLLGWEDKGLQAMLTELSTTSQRFPYLKMVVVGGENG